MTTTEKSTTTQTELDFVRPWLEGLIWDGRPRLNRWVRDYLGARGENNECEYGALWMISAVARLFAAEGCRADGVLYLIGEQGTGKTRVFATLAGSENLVAHLAGEDFERADVREIGEETKTAWLIETSGALNQVAGATYRVFVGMRSYRPLYAKRSHHRRSVNAVTGVYSEYLAGALLSGARWVWPVRCGPIDRAGLAGARNQLWAEAVAQFSNGTKWWRE